MTSTLDPQNAITPSAAVAEASNRIVSDLVAMISRDGYETAVAEAMAMHRAALSFLRPSIGVEGVSAVLDLARAENARIAARDAANAEAAARRRVTAKRREAQA